MPWGLSQDWQLRRNKAAYPRAWSSTTRVRPLPCPIQDRADPDRDADFHERSDLAGKPPNVWTFARSPWSKPTDREPPRVYLSQHRLDHRSRWRLSKRPPAGGAESDAGPAWPGDPGRHPLSRLDLTIDGKAAPIYRANRLMRGAAVPSGEHSLVYTYEPMSFRAGGVLSAVGLLILLTSAWSSRQGRPVRHASRERSVVTHDREEARMDDRAEASPWWSCLRLGVARARGLRPHVRRRPGLDRARGTRPKGCGLDDPEGRRKRDV